MRIKDSKLQALQSIEVLRDLPASRLRKLSALVDEVSITAGTTLIHQGQLNRHAYFIESGAVSIDVDGERIATVGSGSIVGERTAIDRGLANATVVTTEATTVFAVDHRVLLGTAASDDAFAALLRALAAGRSNVAA